jgi:hypothetical protein
MQLHSAKPHVCVGVGDPGNYRSTLQVDDGGICQFATQNLPIASNRVDPRPGDRKCLGPRRSWISRVDVSMNQQRVASVRRDRQEQGNQQRERRDTQCLEYAKCTHRFTVDRQDSTVRDYSHNLREPQFKFLFCQYPDLRKSRLIVGVGKSEQEEDDPDRGEHAEGGFLTIPGF